MGNWFFFHAMLAKRILYYRQMFSVHEYHLNFEHFGNQTNETITKKKRIILKILPKYMLHLIFYKQENDFRFKQIFISINALSSVLRACK